MSERERLAADARRLEWLADARFGPARITTSPRPESAISPLGIWRFALSAALLLGQRIRARPSGRETAPSRASVPVR